MRSSTQVIGLICLVVVVAAAKPALADALPNVPASTQQPASPSQPAKPDSRVAVREMPHRKDATAQDLRPTVALAAPPLAGPGPTPLVTHTSLTSIGSTHQDVAGPVSAETAFSPPATVSSAPTPKPMAGLRTLRRMNASQVFASLQPAFQACYDQSASALKGVVVVQANAGATGEVESAEIVSNTGLTSAVASCVADRIHEARFGAPGGAGASIQLPVQLSPTR
jgi:hypothetical protein